MPYDPRVVQPMREEMVRMGVQELKTVAEVDAALGDQRGTTLVFVNSVCGCAAGSARPGLSLALQHGNRPQRVVTVFAGVDLEASARARQYFSDYAPELSFTRPLQRRRGGPLCPSSPDRGTGPAGHRQGPGGGVRQILRNQFGLT